MSRYFSRKRPSAWVEDETGSAEPFRPHLSVSDHEEINTGLLNADGDTSWRAPRGMGFGSDIE